MVLLNNHLLPILTHVHKGNRFSQSKSSLFFNCYVSTIKHGVKGKIKGLMSQIKFVIWTRSESSLRKIKIKTIVPPL